MTLRVELVVPDGEIWSGRARMVIAKTLDGDIGVLTGHRPCSASWPRAASSGSSTPRTARATAGQHVRPR